MSAAAPLVTVKARTVAALLKEINRALPLFDAPPIEMEAVDLKDEELPSEIMRALQMMNDAVTDFSGEPAVDIENMDTDTGALLEIAKLGKALADKALIRFLKTEKKEASRPQETEVEEEDTGEISEDDMMMRM
jgi:hypothetical protein